MERGASVSQQRLPTLGIAFEHLLKTRLSLTFFLATHQSTRYTQELVEVGAGGISALSVAYLPRYLGIHITIETSMKFRLNIIELQCHSVY